MTDLLLPATIPIVTASVIAGQSPRSFRRYVIVAGLVETDDRGRVLLASLERHLRRQISTEAYLRAERKRDQAREYQRQYRRGA